MEIRDNDGPEPLVRRFRITVEFDQRCAEHTVGPPDHRLEERGLVFEMVQNDTFGNASDLADLLKCRPTESIKDHSLECRL